MFVAFLPKCVQKKKRKEKTFKCALNSQKYRNGQGSDGGPGGDVDGVGDGDGMGVLWA